MTAGTYTLPQEVVVDASVVAKWLLPEEDSAVAELVLTASCSLIAPDLLFPEVGNLLWKRVQRGEIDAEHAARLTDWLCSLPMSRADSRDLVRAALDIACSYGRSVYDSVYVALAVREHTKLLTADTRLANTLIGTPLEEYVLPISALGTQTGRP